ncbi:MAG: GTPase HflX [bacterium]|nr:GTPase HflX [bacterium]
MHELVYVEPKKERAIIVGVLFKGVNKQWLNETLEEMRQLADTAGAIVVDTVVQERLSPDRTTFIGKGLVVELAERVQKEKIDVILFDDDLTPAQTRNLENVLQTKVVDRTGLILDIFAIRAKTREAEIQVELAQLEYQLPRLTGRWKHLERQRGGIDMRGPGETQLETDRRLVRERIAHLKKLLEHIQQSRQVQRSRRDQLFKVAIVGYTNAGKSTLFRALTGGNPFIENRLFATLDPLVRPMRLPHCTEPILLSDTVGFIRKLPHSLVASFHSTLEETTTADLLLHVVDLSNPAFETQMSDVLVVLKEIHADQIPTLLIFNKMDKVQDDQLIARVRKSYPDALFISAERGHRIWELKNRLAEIRSSLWEGYEIVLTAEGSGKGLAAIYEYGEVIHQETLDDGRMKIRYKVPMKNYRKLEEILYPLMWKQELPKRKLSTSISTIRKKTLKMQQKPLSKTRRQSQSTFSQRKHASKTKNSYPTTKRKNAGPKPSPKK